MAVPSVWIWCSMVSHHQLRSTRWRPASSTRFPVTYRRLMDRSPSSPCISVWRPSMPGTASNGLWHGVGMEFHLGLHGFAALRGLSLIQLVHMINAEFIPAETQIRFSPVLPEIPAAAESGPADAVEDTAVLPHPENSAKSMVSARRTDIIVRFITDSPF